MHGFYKLVAISWIASSASIALAQAPVTTLGSADGWLTLTFGIHLDGHSSADNGRLVYAVKFAGKQVLDESGLSLDLEGAEPLGEHVHIVASQASEGLTISGSQMRGQALSMRFTIA